MLIPLDHLDFNNTQGNDKLKEECGVFAVYSKNNDPEIYSKCYYGLLALQHRGQESAGITFLKNGQLETIKGMGLVTDVFNEKNLNISNANAAIGHVRYSTTGDSNLSNAQPLTGYSKLGQISVAHNGNLINTRLIRSQLEDDGVVFQSTTDSELILNLISKNAAHGLKEAISTTCQTLKGAFALVILINNKLVGVRDPLAIRPLCLGYIEEHQIYILASESRAFDVVGAIFVRDILAGEMVIIDEKGVESHQYAVNCKSRMCSFEYIYFAKPDSTIDGINAYTVRYKTGEELYHQLPVDADVVIGVPDSGTAAALGFANASKIPYGLGLIRNRHVGRTFILPSQDLREKAVKLKLNTVKPVIAGKRVVVVDDSLVRGTTAKQLVALLREGGATEVHFRLASPMVKDVCYFGIDIPDHKNLIAHNMSNDQICKLIGADSLDYLSIDNLTKVLGSNEFCNGCFSGNYPIKIDTTTLKLQKG